MEVDQDLNFTLTSKDAVPLLFEPDIDWAGFSGPNIIDGY